MTQTNKYSLKNIKRHYYPSSIALRADDEQSNNMVTIEGYAVVWDSLYDMFGDGSVMETVRKGAFSKTIQESDIRVLKNHNSDKVIGRNTEDAVNKLEMYEDDYGLFYRLKIDTGIEQTSDVKDLIIDIRNRHITQNSWGGWVIKHNEIRSADNGNALIELKEIRLFDISPVVFPAYTETSVSVRTALEVLADNDFTLLQKDERDLLESSFEKYRTHFLSDDKDTNTKPNDKAQADSRESLEVTADTHLAAETQRQEDNATHFLDTIRLWIDTEKLKQHN